MKRVIQGFLMFSLIVSIILTWNIGFKPLISRYAYVKHYTQLTSEVFDFYGAGLSFLSDIFGVMLNPDKLHTEKLKKREAVFIQENDKLAKKLPLDMQQALTRNLNEFKSVTQLLREKAASWNETETFKFYKRQQTLEKSFRNLWDEIQRSIGNFKDEKLKQTAVVDLVPDAIAALKTHPNDSNLCQVMKTLGQAKDVKTLALQTAFFEVGEKYCPDYYNKRSAWRLEQPHREFSLTKIDMTYREYYNTQIQPRLKSLLQQFKADKIVEDVCASSRMIGQTRDADEVAMTEVYRSLGSKKCAPRTISKYSDTGVSCVNSCTLTYNPDLEFCVEYCKRTPGILFKQASTQE